MAIGPLLLSLLKGWAGSGHVERGVRVAIEDQGGLWQFPTLQLLVGRVGRLSFLNCWRERAVTGGRTVFSIVLSVAASTWADLAWVSGTEAILSFDPEKMKYSYFY